MDHSIVRDAFDNVCDKNALAWSVLNGKSECAVTAAIALAANRRAGRRIAVVEHRRVDLAIVNGTMEIALYEAKAAYTSDFQPTRLGREDKWLGASVDRDLKRLCARKTEVPMARRAALFYLYEVAVPRVQMKYVPKASVPLDRAKDALLREVTLGTVADESVIDCGAAAGSGVRICLFIFEHRSDLPGSHTR